MNSIGNKIIDLRKQKGLSQEDLADLAKVNVRTIQRIENNENIPRGNTLNLISEGLDINPDELLQLNNDSNKKSIGDTIANIVFLVVFNILLISLTGYFTLDVNANTNSRTAAYLLSVLIPFFIVLKTGQMKPTERLLKFGFGYIFYIISSIIMVGIPTSFVTGLLPNLLISLGVLFYGNEIKRMLKF